MPDWFSRKSSAIPAARSHQRKGTIILVLLGSITLGMGLPEIAQSAKPTEESTPFPAVSATPINSPLRVGVKPIVPFVFAEGADVPYGYSIDLWNALAERLGVETTFVVYETVPELLDAVRDRQVDVAIAGISITQEREASGLDFSYPV